MARRTIGVIGCLLVALSLCVVGPPAQAQGCYPPPCGAATAASEPDFHGDVIATSREVSNQPAAPFVAVGLLLVTATLATLCVQRRLAMAAVRGPDAPAVPAARPKASSPSRNRQRSLA